MQDAIRQHIEGKFASAQVEKFPFPHLIIENFFPEDVYDRILKFNPFQKNAGVEWITKKAASRLRTETPYYARKQINFHENQQFAASEDEAAFWNGIKDVFLGDHWFETLVYEKYRDFFDLRFGEAMLKPDFFGKLHKELFLQRHEPGYYIGPHTDIPTRVFTCIFSFSDREGFDQFGTQLCRHKDELARCWGTNHYGPEDFDVVKTAPYRPNNFLLFFKTRQSFHAVQAIDDTVPNQRYGMQFQMYEPWNGLFRDLSAPGLMRLGHVKKSRFKKFFERFVP
ncbi:hypothetical protein EUC41_08880 [Achromobacter denitrificans]|uniref:hypothetical protein n=1 Tax=Achromobacter denitrificans TaxID=32002 RepID=UPI00240E6E32|nr:hypothetical protein [Achromobacter denitrificans]WFC66418.1 hypothetical protein EUC41_08880 [Achromobacter denitrificans]